MSTQVIVNDEDRLLFRPPDERRKFLVAGDPLYDRLTASIQLRERYRSRFGLSPRQRFVVLSSTWGPDSLFGTNPELPARLVAELPVDAYRLALALHPHVWFGHGPWQVRTWLTRPCEGGLILLDPEDSWRAALVAADVIVGDHGSVPFYGAALGRPVLLASKGGDEVNPSSATGALMATAPALEQARRLEPQIEAVIAGHHPQVHSNVVSRMFPSPGRALPVIRQAAYAAMRLSEPDHSARVSLSQRLRSFRANRRPHASTRMLRGRASSSGDTRFGERKNLPPPPPLDCATSQYRKQRSTGDQSTGQTVIVRDDAVDAHVPTARWAQRCYGVPGLPGSGIVGASWVELHVRGRGRMLIEPLTASRTPWSHGITNIVGSAVYASDVTGRLDENTDAPITITAGGNRWTVLLRPVGVSQ